MQKMLQTPADPLHRCLVGPEVFMGCLTCVCTSGHVCVQVCVCVELHTFTCLAEGRIFFMGVMRMRPLSGVPPGDEAKFATEPAVR